MNSGGIIVAGLTTFTPGGPAVGAALAGDVDLARQLSQAWSLGAGVALGFVAPPAVAPAALAGAVQTHVLGQLAQATHHTEDQVRDTVADAVHALGF